MTEWCRSQHSLNEPVMMEAVLDVVSAASSWQVGCAWLAPPAGKTDCVADKERPDFPSGGRVASSRPTPLQQAHRSAIQALAEETCRPLDDINRIYCEVFDKLNADARIKDYLIVLTARTVRDSLRHSGPDA